MAKRGRKPRAYWEAIRAAELDLEAFDSQHQGHPVQEHPPRPLQPVAGKTAPSPKIAPPPMATPPPPPKKLPERHQSHWRAFQKAVDTALLVETRQFNDLELHTSPCTEMTANQVNRLAALFLHWEATLQPLLEASQTSEDLCSIFKKVEDHETNLRLGGATIPAETFAKIDSLHFQLRGLCLRLLPIDSESTAAAFHENTPNVSAVEYFADMHKCLAIFQKCVSVKCLHRDGIVMRDWLKAISECDILKEAGQTARICIGSEAADTNGWLEEIKNPSTTAEAMKAIFGENDEKFTERLFPLFQWHPAKSAFEDFVQHFEKAESVAFESEVDKAEISQMIAANSSIVLFPLFLETFFGLALQWGELFAKLPMRLKGVRPKDIEKCSLSDSSRKLYLVGRVRNAVLCESVDPLEYNVADVLPQCVLVVGAMSEL